MFPSLKFSSNIALEKVKPFKLYLCQLINKTNEPNETIDEPLVVFFKGKKSYTGEDSAELHLHGGQYIVESTLTHLYRLGFKPAEPESSQRRAFLNGKLDLTAAEGIKELANANSRQQWLAARSLATGKLFDEIESLRDTLMEAIAWLEARIDFPDEGETSDLELLEVEKKVHNFEKQLKTLRSTFSSGKVATDGLKIALFGAPNSGKSTLMNTLLGEERSIVTEIAGTTRDYLEEPCLLDGRLIRIIDTAGINLNTNIDLVEKIGIQKSFEIAKSADLILFLCPSNSKSPDHLDKWIYQFSGKDYLRIVTKSDLLESPSWSDGNYIKVTCKAENGVETLRSALIEKVDQNVDRIKDTAFITSPRHKKALDDASAHINRFKELKAERAYDEMLAFELQRTADCLQSIIGEFNSDDILGVIFESFCVGK